MKLSKRPLALLLALALAFALAVPAFAEESLPEELTPAVPVITTQPRNTRVIESGGASVQVGIKAHIPGGGEVRYRMYLGDQLIQDTSLPYISSDNVSGMYHIEAYNRVHPEYYTTSKTFRVEVSKLSLIEMVFGPIIAFVGMPLLIMSPVWIGIVLSPYFLVKSAYDWIAGLF